ncbi:MAG: ATP-binding cassette domain-containing protein [Bauldia sp.]
MNLSPPAIALRNVELVYTDRVAVHGLSGDFTPGSLTAVIGPNGGGKSTLLAALAGLLRPSRGSIAFAGGDAPDIAYLPQDVSLDRAFPISVTDLVAFGLWRRTLGRAESAAAVNGAIAAVGLSGLETRSVGSLSGGQLQRALLARLLVQDAPVVLLDEPLSSVDPQTEETVLQLIARWHADGRTVIVALHDVAHVSDLFPTTLFLDGAPVAWGPTADVLAAHPLAPPTSAADRFHRLAAA